MTIEQEEKTLSAILDCLNVIDTFQFDENDPKIKKMRAGVIDTLTIYIAYLKEHQYKALSLNDPEVAIRQRVLSILQERTLLLEGYVKTQAASKTGGLVR